MLPRGFRLGEFVVEPGADRLLGPAAGARIDLEPKTMAVLLVLVERRGEVVSSDELIHVVWRDRPMGENPVYKAIAKLRRAFGDDATEPRYIETIPRKGYRLLIEPAPLATVRVAAPTTPSPPAASAGQRWLPTPQARARVVAVLGLIALLVALGGVAAFTRHDATPRMHASAPAAQLGRMHGNQ